MTIDDLAVMVQNGFSETARKIDLDSFRDEVNGRLDNVETRLDRIENLILTDHRSRIERLEDTCRVLETSRK